MANQSVALCESLNESSIQLQTSSRRQTDKIVKNQSDEPADNSDIEDRGDEIDLDDLKVVDVALAPEISKQATSRAAVSAFGALGNNSVGSGVQSFNENRQGMNMS